MIHREGRRTLTLGDFCRQALKKHPELEVYLLIWDWEIAELPFLGGLWAPGSPSPVPQAPPVPSRRAFADESENSRLHVALHANPPMGSHHQKMVLCDLDSGTGGASLHCLGLNFENAYWDIEGHPFPNAYPDMDKPWHDTGARIEGPVVAEFEAEFRRRWKLATKEELRGEPLPSSGGGRSQVKALIHREKQERPSPVKDWYVSAIAAAREVVYLENQYFDDPDVADALWRAYLAAETAGRPLRAALVLPWWDDLKMTYFPPWHPIAPWMRRCVTEVRVRTARRFKLRSGDAVYERPAGGWPEVHAPLPPERALELANPANPGGLEELAKAPRHFEVRTPSGWVQWKDVEWVEGGIEVYQLMACSGRWPPHPVYVHSKLGVIDDAYTVGSSNISGQSFFSDSEANVVVEGREEVLALVGDLWPDLVGATARPSGDLGLWLDTFAATARQNRSNADAARSGKRAADPVGLLLPWEPYD